MLSEFKWRHFFFLGLFSVVFGQINFRKRVGLEKAWKTFSKNVSSLAYIVQNLNLHWKVIEFEN